MRLLDGEPWDDGDEHILLLQRKVERYVDFVEGGELGELFKKKYNSELAPSVPVVIHVICRYEPSDRGREFLTYCGGVVAESGVALQASVFAGKGAAMRRIV
ncbi:MAG: hypothetical protein KC492_00970 [Myxococcales bacterium]|nr:hypothetical protein [Myxococcales bacterium]